MSQGGEREEGTGKKEQGIQRKNRAAEDGPDTAGEDASATSVIELLPTVSENASASPSGKQMGGIENVQAGWRDGYGRLGTFRRAAQSNNQTVVAIGARGSLKG
jgi:hypothetical protein